MRHIRSYVKPKDSFLDTLDVNKAKHSVNIHAFNLVDTYNSMFNKASTSISSINKNATLIWNTLKKRDIIGSNDFNGIESFIFFNDDTSNDLYGITDSYSVDIVYNSWNKVKVEVGVKVINGIIDKAGLRFKLGSFNKIKKLVILQSLRS